MTARLPLLCRIRRHGWRPRAYWPGWTRKTCKRCEHIDLPTPDRSAS